MVSTVLAGNGGNAASRCRRSDGPRL